MNSLIVQTTTGITLAGGGPFGRRDLSLCLARAPIPVAADGGADRLLAFGVTPEAVIGDFDSLTDAAQRAIPSARQHRMAEQATTDFDKALRSVHAPFVLALGFAGARQDHGLAALNTLVRRPERRCIVLGPKDLIFAAPERLELEMAPGDILSLFPMTKVSGHSRGLEWPIDGLDLAPDAMIGTSNQVTARRVELAFDRPGMLVILSRPRLDAAIRALMAATLPAPRSARGG